MQKTDQNTRCFSVFHFLVVNSAETTTLTTFFVVLMIMFAHLFALLFTNRSPHQTILKNTGWLLLSEALHKWGVFFITLLIAHLLWPEQFGLMSYVVSIVTLCTVLTDYGLTNLVVKEASVSPTQTTTYFLHGLVLKSILAGITFLVVYWLSFFVNTALSRSLLLVYCGYALITNISEFLRTRFRPHELMHHEAWLKIVNGVVFVALSVLTLVVRGTLAAVLRWYIISAVISLIISISYLLWYHKKDPIIWTIDPHILMMLAKKWAFLALGVCFVTVYINGDQFLLGYYGFTYDLGIYALGYKMTFLYTVIFGMFYQSILPRIAKHPTQANYLTGVRYITLLNSILIVIYATVGYFLLVQPYRALWTYHDSLIVFLRLLIYCVFESYGQRIYMNLLALGKEIRIVQLLGTCAAINIGGNILLIPLYSYRWAIVMTIITYIVLCLCGWWFLQPALRTSSIPSNT